MSFSPKKKKKQLINKTSSRKIMPYFFLRQAALPFFYAFALRRGKG